jgi:hypothetical protein
MNTRGPSHIFQYLEDETSMDSGSNSDTDTTNMNASTTLNRSTSKHHCDCQVDHNELCTCTTFGLCACHHDYCCCEDCSPGLVSTS